MNGHQLKTGLLLTYGALVIGFGLGSSRAAQAEDDILRPGDATNAIPFWRDLDRWSFQAGVASITRSTIDDILAGDGKLNSDDRIYLLQVSYKVAALDPTLFGHPVKLDLELPLVLGLIDERGHDLFPQYSAGLTL